MRWLRLLLCVMALSGCAGLQPPASDPATDARSALSQANAALATCSRQFGTRQAELIPTAYCRAMLAIVREAPKGAGSDDEVPFRFQTLLDLATDIRGVEYVRTHRVYNSSPRRVPVGRRPARLNPALSRFLLPVIP